MMVYILSMVTQWRLTVGVLCATMLYMGCATTQDAGLSETEAYPCEELELAEKNYRALKQHSPSDQEQLQEMRQKINVLQQECESYREKVSWYTRTYGYSSAEAEKKAAVSIRSNRTHEVKTTNISAGTVIAVVLGVAAVGLITFLAVVAYDLSHLQ